MPAPQRRVRRKPLSERVAALLNPMDFLLWLSEELETRDWDSKALGTQIGVLCNVVFPLARANSGAPREVDDVFGDDGGSGWLPYLVHLVVWSLVAFSLTNAVYTLKRSRRYRLFEVDVERQPDTPSARRVRVQSSPAASSPLRLLADFVAAPAETAEQRAHPDKTRDVWELSVWDPLPVCLRVFCLFGPGHVLVYLLFLPLLPLDPRPSITVFNVLLLQALLSAQLLLLQGRFTQQVKDTAIIHREVLHEYDTKFVQPRLHPVVRDVGTQFSEGAMHEEDREFVETGTPTTIIRRGFQTHPNLNYQKHFDPDGVMTASGHGNVMSPRMFTPTPMPAPGPVQHTPVPAVSAMPQPPSSRASDASFQHFRTSTSRQSLPANVNAFATSPSLSRTSTATSTTRSGTQAPSHGGLGGNLGIFSHHNSPLKKATSMNEMNQSFSPRNSREMAALEQRDATDRLLGRSRRGGSPLKEENRRSTLGGAEVGPGSGGGGSGNLVARNPFGNARRDFSQYERYPSLR